MTFWQTNSFLGIVTGLALLLLAFPSYSDWLYRNKPHALVKMAQARPQQVVYVTVKGMTCNGCETHVKSQVSKLNGVINTQVSYSLGQAVVKFDPTQTSADAIRKAVVTTGYQVAAIRIK